MPKPSTDAQIPTVDAKPAHVVETVVTRQLRESREWSMSSRPQLRTELERPRQLRRSRRQLRTPEKKWKEWLTNKKRMLPTRRSLMLETKLLRKQRRLPEVLEPVVLLMPLSRKLRMLPSH